MAASETLFQSQQIYAIVARICPVKNSDDQAQKVVLLFQEISFYRLNKQEEEIAQNVVIRLCDTKASVTICDVIAAWRDKPELHAFAQAVADACY